MKKKRRIYLFSAVLIFITEVIIALFVRDSFIRPYGGDILVTLLLCLGIKGVFPYCSGWMPLWVFLFSVAVEVGQYFDFVSLLGLGNIEFFRVLMGTSFAFADILCYALGCGLFLVLDMLYAKVM